MFETVLKEIEKRAEMGLRAATEHALERAQHHAPVRAIFDRDRRGPAFDQRFKTMRSRSRYEAFLRSKSRSRPISTRRLAGIQRREVTAVLTSGRRIGGEVEIPPNEAAARADRLSSGARLTGARTRTRFTGNNNTIMPVFREGNSRITGDFRRYRAPTGDIVRQKSGRRARGVRGESVERFAEQRGIPNPVERMRRQRLTSRGRYEVRRAEQRGLFQGRVGGRLRGELRITGPHRRGNTIWMYVESPTPYAKYQEFGTQRHRAQPFLRPALYESRNVLRWEVRKAVDKRFNTLPEFNQ